MSANRESLINHGPYMAMESVWITEDQMGQGPRPNVDLKQFKKNKKNKKIPYYSRVTLLNIKNRNYHL
jgi:hypothetical protein